MNPIRGIVNVVLDIIDMAGSSPVFSLIYFAIAAVIAVLLFNPGNFLLSTFFEIVWVVGIVVVFVNLIAVFMFNSDKDEIDEEEPSKSY